MKKTKKVLGMVCIFMSLFILWGCASSAVEELGRFSIISTKNVDLSRLSSMGRSSNKAVTTNLNVKGIIKKTELSSKYVLENALDSALESIPGAVALVDAKLTYVTKKGAFKDTWGYVFEGTALIDRDTVSEANIDEEYYFFVNDDCLVQFIDKESFDSMMVSIL